MPANTTEGVAGSSEEEDAEDPDGTGKAECADFGEADAAKGVPEEKAADEQAGDGFEEVLPARGGGHARGSPAGRKGGVDGRHGMGMAIVSCGGSRIRLRGCSRERFGVGRSS